MQSLIFMCNHLGNHGGYIYFYMSDYKNHLSDFKMAIINTIMPALIGQICALCQRIETTRSVFG